MLVKLLEAELVHAQLWTVCVALRGVRWDSLPAEQRELALQAKDAALRCLEIYLRSQNFRAHLKCESTRCVSSSERGKAERQRLIDQMPRTISSSRWLLPLSFY